MVRAIVLSLMIMISVGVMLPLATDWTEAARPKHSKKHKKVKKYSKAWWRQYRAKQRRQRARAAYRRALAKRREAMARVRVVSDQTAAKQKMPETVQYVPVLGKGEPQNWKGQVAAGSSDVKFSVADTSGQTVGSAELSVVAPAIPNGDDLTSEKSRSRTLGGVPVSSLRRTVIDKMIKENGYIVNDYQREVGGKRVFVVVAQTQNGGTTQSRQFYFTEVDGRIYSLATDTANDFSEKIAADSEQVLTAIHRNSQPAQSADLK